MATKQADIEVSGQTVKGLNKREMFGDQTLTIKHCLVTKHANVEVSGQTVKMCLIKQLIQAVELVSSRQDGLKNPGFVLNSPFAIS